MAGGVKEACDVVLLGRHIRGSQSSQLLPSGAGPGNHAPTPRPVGAAPPGCLPAGGLPLSLQPHDFAGASPLEAVLSFLDPLSSLRTAPTPGSPTLSTHCSAHVPGEKDEA